MAWQHRLYVWETTLMETSPIYPQCFEDRKVQKLIERIERQRLQERAAEKFLGGNVRAPLESYGVDGQPLNS
jgi:hypothetical protein